MKANARIYRNRWLAIIGMAIGVMVCGCTDDLGIEGNRPSDVVCFTASLGSDSLRTGSRSVSGHLGIEEEEWRLEGMPEVGGSRASLTTSLTGTAGVIGYSDDNVLSSLSNVEFTFDGDELSSATPVYWKSIEEGLTSMEVYVYAPYNELKNTITGKTFTYTIPSTADKQLDIIVAKSTVASSGFRKTIPLTFTHALTAVRFALGEDIAANDVQSITISGVHNQGSYTIGEGWSGQTHSGEVSYTVTPNELLMLMPQTLSEDATVTLTNNDNSTIKAELKGKWEEGRLITYTLHKGTPPSYIYFDLAAGNVSIDNSTYSGKIYVAGEAKDVTGTHNPDNIYYVYQSTTSTEEVYKKFDKNHTGYETQADFDAKKDCRIPKYDPVKAPDGRLWSDFITNNTSVETVIETWDDGKFIREDKNNAPDEALVGTAMVREVGRTHTSNYIKVTGSNTQYNLTIDNIYSVIQTPITSNFRLRNVGGIAYMPSENTELTVNLVGDNRMGCLHIDNDPTDRITLQGTGSLTAADADFLTVKCAGNHADKADFGDSKGYISNFWNSAIGNNTDDGIGEEVYNLYISGGVVFAGATKAEDCTAIGGGGNGYGQVYITGGVVTAVATTAGTAIGGGMGHNANGGPGEVHISGGKVYAYNFANQWGIASSAIGGGGSYKATGSYGTVEISGGYVYAYSVLGTAIGGGSSRDVSGGGATIEISGGTVIAKSESMVSIGGGSSYLQGGAVGSYHGGTANVTISGNPVIRTGSVGGGTTKDTKAHIGSAIINISGNPDIQAQFVLAKGTSSEHPNSFEMTGGTIRNSNVDNDVDKEYFNVEENGGAVYLENGTCKISGGAIMNCTAANGGAIYQKGGEIILSGGTISDNLAKGGHGGGIYIREGSFEMNGTAVITRNSSIQREDIGGYGGGLYVTSDASDVAVNILSGSITENTSDRRGGGVCVDMSGTSHAANVIVGTSGEAGPNISKNHTLLSGGGLYVSGRNANITINGGTIMNNTTSAYVANVNVANEGGMVTLNEGDVTHNVVTFYANGGTGETQVQKIVTATNSLLVAPTFTRVGYNLEGWNTRADGRGDNYTDGQVMNISEDMELYAQWELD